MSNNYLFAEFEISGNKTYNDNPICFKNGYKLKDIDKKKLLDIIVNIMNNNFKTYKYFITTRTKENTKHFFIVLTLIHF